MNLQTNIIPTILALEPKYHLEMIERVLNAREKSATHIIKAFDDDEDEKEPWWKSQDMYGEPLPCPQKMGNVAILPIKGIIGYNYPQIFRSFGICDIKQIHQWVDAVENDAEINTVIFHIDSPGGSVVGLPEIAERVSKLSETKNTIAFTETQMCSAAYYIGSQCNRVVVTPSADVGSIGTYMCLYDYTKMLDEIGIKAELIKNGTLKAIGAMGVPLTDEQRAYLQQQVDLITAGFKTAVTSKRTKVSDDTMQGQSFMGIEAINNGLATGLVNRFSELLGSLTLKI